MEFTLTLTLEELMALPGDAVMRLLEKAAPDKATLMAAHDYENRPLHGKGRWPVNNYIRDKLKAL